MGQRAIPMMGTKKPSGLFQTQQGKPSSLPLDRLVPFENHPFIVKHDAEFDELCRSIKENGVIQPILVRPHKAREGYYEIIAGHRRVEGSNENELTHINAYILDLDDDSAIILMVESNKYQRDFSKLLHSEKAKALKMQLDAAKRKEAKSSLGLVGPKKDETDTDMGLVGPSEEGCDTSLGLLGPNEDAGLLDSQYAREQIAESNDLSPRTVSRLIRLNELVPALLQMVDDKKIGLYPAVELSFIGRHEQQQLTDTLQSGRQYKITMDNARPIRQLYEAGVWDMDKVSSLMTTPKKASAIKPTVSIPRKRLPESLAELPNEKLLELFLEFCKTRQQAS